MKYLLKNIQVRFIFFIWALIFTYADVNAQFGAGTNSPLPITVHGTAVTGVYLGHGSFNQTANTAVGVGALANTTSTPNNCTGIGYNALTALTYGSGNTSVGSGSSSQTDSGYNNSVLGYGALQLNKSGYFNTAMGDVALGRNISGYYNTGIGSAAAGNLNSGNYNTFVGARSGFNGNYYSNSTGTNNTALGSFSLNSLVSGDNNVALGSSALSNLTNGNNNVAIGYQVYAPSATANYTLAIQNGIFGSNMNTQASSLIGIGRVPIATPSTPAGVVPPGTYCKLHVAGTSTTIPSLQLDYVPAVGSATGRSYLFVDANGVVAQSPIPGASFCTNTGYIPRATDAFGNTGCSQVYDNLTNIGIAVGTAPTAKLDIDLTGAAGAAGTVRLRNLQVNTGVYMNEVLIDANGNLWRSGSTTTRTSSPKDQEIQNDKIDKLETEVKNLKELVELMMKNGNTLTVKKPFTVYPNPAKNIVRIEKSERATTEANQYVEIRDINNQVVLEKQIFKQSLNITLDNKLVSGTYLLVIYQNQQIIQTEKITIAK